MKVHENMFVFLRSGKTMLCPSSPTVPFTIAIFTLLLIPYQFKVLNQEPRTPAPQPLRHKSNLVQ